MCDHKAFAIDGNVSKAVCPGEEATMFLHVRVVCTECQQVFSFLGNIVRGLNHDGVAVSQDRCELRVPIMPAVKPAKRSHSKKVAA